MPNDKKEPLASEYQDFIAEFTRLLVAFEAASDERIAAIRIYDAPNAHRGFELHIELADQLPRAQRRVVGAAVLYRDDGLGAKVGVEGLVQ